MAFASGGAVHIRRASYPAAKGCLACESVARSRSILGKLDCLFLVNSNRPACAIESSAATESGVNHANCVIGFAIKLSYAQSDRIDANQLLDFASVCESLMNSSFERCIIEHNETSLHWFGFVLTLLLHADKAAEASPRRTSEARGMRVTIIWLPILLF